MDWIDLAQNKGQWRALVNTASDLMGPEDFGNFSTSLITAQQGLSECHEHECIAE
jgi:hypothetical protein